MLKRSRFTGLILLLMGLMFLFWYLTQPRVQMLHDGLLAASTGYDLNLARRSCPPWRAPPRRCTCDFRCRIPKDSLASGIDPE
jgi:hypothetical protein